MYDVIVVGARCAGSPTAMLLSRAGYRVLLVDKVTFPSDTVSSHYLHLAGVARLRAWGLLDRVLATGVPKIEKLSYGVNGIYLNDRFPAAHGETFGLATRRKVIDEILVDAAEEAGAEIRQGVTVLDVLWDGGTVTGVRLRDRTGEVEEIHAKMVIGADGIHSAVAEAVKPAEYDGAPPGTAYWYSYWQGTDITEFVFTRIDGCELFIAPTNDDCVTVMVGWRHDRFREIRSDIEGNYLRALELFPAFGTRVLAGRRVEPFYGSRFTRQWMRTPYGPGWALVGDAGYHRDPIVGVGMSDAFTHANQLVAAIDDGFSGRRELSAALAEFHAWRDERVRPTFEYAKRIATLDPLPPEMLAVIAALEFDDEQRQEFFRIFGGDTDFRKFFQPENAQRIVGRAARRKAELAGRS